MSTIPSSTYRLQLHKGFSFYDAMAVADYLQALGVSHVYSSPYLQAAPGSAHGYDVVDHRVVNSELGGSTAHQLFCNRLHDLGLGQILDIVPNHMSLGEQNRSWWDVLENGRSSRYAAYFDIDWDSIEPRLRDRVLVPILPDHYGRVLNAGGIVLQRNEHQVTVAVGEQTFPLSPKGLGMVLERAAAIVRHDQLAYLASALQRLPTPGIEERSQILARDREKLVLLGFLEVVCHEGTEACAAIDQALQQINEDADALDQILATQNYRLAYWKTADQQLAYRRFFNVNTLIGLRMERDYVFDETHSLIVQWLTDGTLDGVRVDHPDGLRDPLQYFQRLRRCAPQAWILGEKILEPGESLPAEWPIHGTTGYEFLNLALGLLVHPDGLRRLDTHYASFTGDSTTFAEASHAARVEVTTGTLGSDVNRLASIFVDICEMHRDQRDFTRNDIRSAIGELAACFPVYRTYAVPESASISESDRQYISLATEQSKANRKDIDPMLFDFLQSVLQLEVTGKLEGDFVSRFQQFTSPVMAKGVEDCAFYRFDRLLALNEVGGNPASEGVSLDQFHHHQQGVQESFPATMVTLSTHDTKRSDDVRARIAVLTELPDAFADSVAQWSTLSSAYRPPEIDRRTEWFLYQTLIGAWPISRDRLAAYMQKAMREAALNTTWAANNSAYEDAVNSYIDHLLDDEAFLRSLESFVERIRFAGQCNSLSQTLLKQTVPGVPDLYQGAELWDLSLVDPDNRRPVDYRLRCQLLHQLEKMDVQQVMERTEEGLPKLFLLTKSLHLRRAHPEWFDANAAYTPIFAEGQARDRLIGYLRGENICALTARWFLDSNGWGDTVVHLAQSRWTNWLTGETMDGATIRVQELFANFPVALLVRTEALNSWEASHA